MNADEIKALLPGVLQRACPAGSPMAAVVDAMVTLLSPCEALIDGVDASFDPMRTRDTVVPFLAQWVGYGYLAEGRRAGTRTLVPHRVLRVLVANAAHASRWRGTSVGLHEILTIVTGAEDIVVEEPAADRDGKPVHFHFRVRAPQRLARDAELLRRVIDHEKPAHVTYELEFGPVSDGEL